ncbi:MAG: Transcriptional regulatory protein LiaR [Glaciihabitans sp.]|nr:Transcriptional regulatory protein LiaR [Glaciihabitans sp.]
MRTVLVAGEAGIGKSRLVSEFAARLDSTSLVLLGRCPELGNEGIPFAPFVTVMRGLLRRLGVTALRALLPPHPALARWLPELAAQTGPVERESDPIRLFGEILILLEELAATQPVVVVLEDLHWADDSSRELLAFLVANLTQRDLLLVGTYRPAAAGPMRGLVLELQRNRGVRLIAPEPLTRYEVGRQLAALLGREPEPGVITRVFDRSAGNPLFVEALSQSPDQTPAGLNELLLLGQSTLPPDTRAVLRLAAVAGSPVEHALLEAAAGLDEGRLHEAVRQLVGQQLLLITDTGYEFRHILIRDAVYDDLLPVERTRLHTRLAQALSTHPDLLPRESHSAELAAHAEAAGDLRQALEASWQAATIAEAAGAPPERLHHLGRVLELWDRVPDAAVLLNLDRLTLLEQILDAGYHSGAAERGIPAADEALARIDSAGDPMRTALLHYQRGCLKNQRDSGGRDDMMLALQLLPVEPATELRGRVLAELAAIRVFTGDPAGAVRDASAAVEVAEQLGVRSLAAHAYGYLGLATAANPEVAVAHFVKARAAAAAAADPYAVVTVAVWQSAALVANGDYRAAIETIQQGLRAAHETFGFMKKGPILIVKWAQALTALGRWREALELIDESLTEPLPPLSTAALLLCHAKIVLARGDRDSAQTSADNAEQLLNSEQWVRQYQLELRIIQCRLALARDEPQLAARILTETLTARDLIPHPHEAWPLLVTGTQIDDVLGSSATQTDSGVDAGLAATLSLVADSLSSSSPVDAAYRTVFTAATTGNPAAWHEAAQAWQELEQPYERAQSLLGTAQSHLATGNRAPALAALRDADVLAAELGAAPLADELRQVAKRARLSLDSPSPEVPAPPPARFGLTARELDVLALVAKGMSNRQIAAELFISSNTAGVHVSHILGKLGAATRTEAAAAAHAHGILIAGGP